MSGRFLGAAFEIYKGDRDGEFRFRLRTAGGSILVESVESFGSKDAAERQIELAVGLAQSAKIVDLTQDG